MRPEKQGASQVASTQGLVPISDEDSKGPVVLTLVEPTQGHDLDKQSVWNVRLKNGELSLSKGEVKVKDLPLAAWYTAAQDLVEADRMAVYDAKRIAYLNEIDFWQEVKERKLLDYADPAVAATNVETAQGKLADLTESVAYRKLIRLQQAFQTLHKAFSEGSESAVEIKEAEATEEVMMLLFNPFK